MAQAGYYRFPTIHQDRVVFTCEDDLWAASVAGGKAERLTSGVAEASNPRFSPDGKWIAYVGKEEGHPEVYVIGADGGPTTRLTYMAGSLTQIAGWDHTGKKVIFATNAQQAFVKQTELWSVAATGGVPEKLSYGPATDFAWGPNGRVVLGRHTADPARWKRYRGGRAGKFWIDNVGKGQFKPLLADLDTNLACPMWLKGRIYFISDHEGTGNIYSCTPTGKDIRRHSDSHDYFVRNATTDGKHIVFHAGGDLFVLDPQTDACRAIKVDWASPQTQRQRKFVPAGKFMDDYDLAPDGSRLAVTTRGKAFTLGHWDGPVLQHGSADGVRYRLARWLNDGKRLVAVTDETGQERLVIFTADGSKPPRLLPKLDLGRVLDIRVNPAADQIALANHRQELLRVDLKRPKITRIDQSKFHRIQGLTWSPDGRWVAYGYGVSENATCLRLYATETGKTHTVTQPVLHDVAPTFDPQGRFLAFLSYRVFDPVYDNMQFDLNFPRGMKPCLITLRKDTPNLLQPAPTAPGKPLLDNGDDDKKKGSPTVTIDLKDMQQRLVELPVPERQYCGIDVGADGKIFLMWQEVPGALSRNLYSPTAPPRNKLECYDLNEFKSEMLLEGISDFNLSGDGKTMAVRVREKLRVLPAGSKPKNDSNGAKASRQTGWVDLGRVRVSVDPVQEWRQMYTEAWRLQQEQFWTPDMSGVAWQRVYRRYLPLIERIASRSEFSDLMWEMQGELGTSHCYEMGGDYRPGPRYQLGSLGANFVYDSRGKGYRIKQILRGTPGDERAASPLIGPGLNIAEGDVLLAIGTQTLDKQTPPQKVLINQAGQAVQLTVRRGQGKPKTFVVQTLADDTKTRYRDWVAKNREYVHRKSKGQVGYVHIPDMGPNGYAEFHRQYFTESEKFGMIVDVRYNRGGHVSPLLLEKLIRTPIGYGCGRWNQPENYPRGCVVGPKVALTNESAGSDGDIFSHCFKLLGIGPLIGKRTWGGVVGIWPRHPLADHSITTQPEFAFWFNDVGWDVENYGTDPDIEVDIAPQHYAANKDPQLDRALQEIEGLIAKTDVIRPDFKNRPKRTLPGERKKG